MVTSLAMYIEQKLNENYKYPSRLRWDGNNLLLDNQEYSHRGALPNKVFSQILIDISYA